MEAQELGHMASIRDKPYALLQYTTIQLFMCINHQQNSTVPIKGDFMT